MNPLRIARSLRDDYLRLLRTTFQPHQTRLQEAFEREIIREGSLTADSRDRPANHLQTMGFRALRFLAREIPRAVGQIRAALGV